MKKGILAICLVTLISQGYSFKDQTPKTNFRQATWGMTLRKVIKIEGNEPQRKMKGENGLDILMYSGKAESLSIVYAYYFVNNKLVQGRYTFSDEHTNKNAYIDDFNKVKDSLIGKYGKPTDDNMFWSNNLYKDDPAKWGMAVAAGHLGCQAKWTLNDTIIVLQLKGDNSNITHAVQYASSIKEHIDLVKKAEEAAKKNIW